MYTYKFQLKDTVLSFCIEQTFDILFDDDEEEKSIATCVLDSILKVHGRPNLIFTLTM